MVSMEALRPSVYRSPSVDYSRCFNYMIQTCRRVRNKFEMHLFKTMKNGKANAKPIKTGFVNIASVLEDDDEILNF